jgi:hypothetical protein
MMIPRKSVSFAVRIGGQRDGTKAVTECDICGLKSCYHRNEGEE